MVERAGETCLAKFLRLGSLTELSGISGVGARDDDGEEGSEDEKYEAGKILLWKRAHKSGSCAWNLYGRE